ncbi:MAG: cysteine hydrolase family protein, partial [Oscillospiraceae bacterium]
LIVVDYQNDFVDGSLGFSGAELLDKRIAGKINRYHENGDKVIFTMDTHSADYLNTQEGKNLPVEHCIKGTDGHKLYGETAKAFREGDMIFEKPAFPSLELANYLKDKPYDNIEIVGLVSNICVISNAIMVKAALPEAIITVDADCTDSFDKEMNRKCLDILKGLQIKVIGG